jgi:short-subunit dehydrogenase
MDPAEVAEQGYKAMLDGKGEVITGWQNKMRVAMALITPAGQLAKTHTREAAPGTATH